MLFALHFEVSYVHTYIVQ